MFFQNIQSKIGTLLDTEFLFTEEVMKEIIVICKNEIKHSDWQKFEKIDFEQDKARIEFWLKSVLKNEPIQKEVNGLWFGIYNPVYTYSSGKKTITCDMYISGNSNYKSNDSEWACSPIYFPIKRYSESKILDAIYKKAHFRKNSLKNNAEYPLCLAYSAFIVKELIDYIPKSNLLKYQNEIGIMVGFDSGDFIHVGKVTKNHGFQR